MEILGSRVDGGVCEVVTKGDGSSMVVKVGEEAGRQGEPNCTWELMKPKSRKQN